MASINLETIKYLEDLNTENGSDVVAEVIGVFLETASKNIQKLKAAHHTKNQQEVRELSHLMKSSFWAVGAQTLVQMMDDIEASASKTNFQFDSMSIQAIEKEFKQACDELLVIKNQREKK